MEALRTKSARPPAMKLSINVPLTTTLNLVRERLPRHQNSNHLQQNYNLYSNERHHPIPSSSPLHAVCERRGLPSPSNISTAFTAVIDLQEGQKALSCAT